MTKIAKKKSSSLEFGLALHRIKNQTDSNIEFSKASLFLLNSLCSDLVNRLVKKTGQLAQYEKKNTRKERHARGSWKLLAAGSLSGFGDAEATKAVNRFVESSAPGAAAVA